MDERNLAKLVQFLTERVQAVRIPVYVYNNPKFTGVALDLPLVQELADLGVAGIKDSSFDIMVLANFVRGIKQPEFDVVLGTEAMFLRRGRLRPLEDPGHMRGVPPRAVHSPLGSRVRSNEIGAGGGRVPRIGPQGVRDGTPHTHRGSWQHALCHD